MGASIFESPQFDILVVDDNPADANIFETALRDGSSRARVYWVASGTEALDFLRQQKRYEKIGPVKLVVLDLHMPRMDGFEILRHIKIDPNLNRIPVVMLTSATSQDEIDLAYSLGANAYFRKPATLESYMELVRVLAQHWLDLAQLPKPGGALRFPSFAEEKLERGSEWE